MEGYPVSEISELLHLSYKTVANYQSAIKNKLDVSNAAQIIRVGLEHGVISSKLEDSSSSVGSVFVAVQPVPVPNWFGLQLTVRFRSFLQEGIPRTTMTYP